MNAWNGQTDGGQTEGSTYRCVHSHKELINVIYSKKSPYLHQEESHTVRLERPAELDVTKLGIQLRHASELAMLLQQHTF